MSGARGVEMLGSEDVAEAVDVLCEAFHDYPVMQFVLGPEGSDYDPRLRTLIHFFVMPRVLRGETLLGLRDGAGLGAVALVSRPEGSESPAALMTFRDAVWAELGPDAKGRYESFGSACSNFEIETPHIHLNMIGARGARRGRGDGRVLLDHVHDLSRADPESEGVSLTTEDEANVALYQYFGYEIVGRVSVSPQLETWGFLRHD
jgi:GNAT superfamily N-acetyltransferase